MSIYQKMELVYVPILFCLSDRVGMYSLLLFNFTLYVFFIFPIKKIPSIVGRLMCFLFSAYYKGTGWASSYNDCAAVINASLYTSSSLQPRERSFTGAFNPCKIGPTASKFPNR
jgi:hypothetical protein